MSTTATTSANNRPNSSYDNLGTQKLNLFSEVQVQTEGSTKVTKPDITKQVRELDTRIKSLLGDGHTASTYTKNIDGHQGKATVDILNKNYKQLMEMAKDPNLTKANRAELKGVIQDIRNLGDSLETSGWYRPNTNPEFRDGSKISDGLARVANAFEKELNAAPLRSELARNGALKLVLDGGSALTVSNVVMTPQSSKPGMKALVPDPELNQKIDAATSWRDLLTIAQAQLERLAPSPEREALQNAVKSINEAANMKVDQSQAPSQIKVPSMLPPEVVTRLTSGNGSSGAGAL